MCGKEKEKSILHDSKNLQLITDISKEKIARCAAFLINLPVFFTRSPSCWKTVEYTLENLYFDIDALRTLVKIQTLFFFFNFNQKRVNFFENNKLHTIRLTN